MKEKSNQGLWKQDADTAAVKRGLTFTNYIHIPKAATTGLKQKTGLDWVWSNTGIHIWNQA